MRGLSLSPSKKITQKCFGEVFVNKMSSFKSNQKFVVFGDFSLDYSIYLAVEQIKQYADQIIGLRCKQLVIKPTRITPTKQSILEPISVNNLLQPHITKSAIVNYDISDHLPSYIHLTLKFSSKNKHRLYSKTLLPTK